MSVLKVGGIQLEGQYGGHIYGSALSLECYHPLEGARGWFLAKAWELTTIGLWGGSFMDLGQLVHIRDGLSRI